MLRPASPFTKKGIDLVHSSLALKQSATTTVIIWTVLTRRQSAGFQTPKTYLSKGGLLEAVQRKSRNQLMSAKHQQLKPQAVGQSEGDFSDFCY